MDSNPLAERQKQERENQKAQEDYRYPYKVVCIYLDPLNNDFPIIHEVRDHCQGNNLVFSARQYDIDRFTDHMIINRLPAFQVYYKKELYETIYFDENPVYKLNCIVWAYQDEQREKERAKLRREERWTEFKALFSLERFKRKGALDLERSLRH
jgi:hypothetical protein